VVFEKILWKLLNNNLKIITMKKYIKLTLVLIISACLFSSCKTASLSVNVLKPAQITVPSNIKTLAVVNRSLPGKGSHLGNIVEGVLSGEGLFVDREASGRTVNGVADALLSSPRFKITVPNGIDIKGTGTSKFAEPLEWSKVKEICKEYSADALILLETFDSNVGRSMTSKEKTKKKDDQTITYMEYTAHLDIGIEAGWRIYYQAKNKIVDQNVFVDHMHWNGVGLSEEEAKRKLPISRLAIKDAGYFAGKQYAVRISPLWVWVSRSYYKKGNDDFVSAKFNVKAQEWDKAKELWMKNINDPDIKIKGYAAYNLALEAEVQGDLDVALDWAKKSYSDFRNRKALSYSRVLQQRIYDQARLKEQMGD